MLARGVKNVIYNYTDVQRKVRSATSNDAWGPSPALMHEIADLTNNVVAYGEIMPIIWKRLNDYGKNWRHVYKSLVLLDHLIKYGNERVSQQCKENLFALQTLKDFQYIEDQQDHGFNIRERSKQLVALLRDDERLRTERQKAQEKCKSYVHQAMGIKSVSAGQQRNRRSSASFECDSEECEENFYGPSYETYPYTTNSNIGTSVNNIMREPKMSEVASQSKISMTQTAKSFIADEKIKTAKTNEITTSNSTSAASPFYKACRNNDIDLVKHYLETMSIEEINKIEPNGSTALHVAAYRGYEEIVELLLENGASHTTINKYNLTPLDEAKTDQIKQMIRQRRHKNRFVSESIEWILATDNADFQAHEYSKKLEAYGKDPHFYQLIIYIKQNYLEKDLQNIDEIDTVKQYFNEAINKQDPVYLLKAYTAETGFYSTLNVNLAQLRLENLTDKENLSRAYYIGIIACHPKFETLSYIGKTFRGMMITNDDFKQYKIGTRILTKTFSSTSKQLDIALQFLDKGRDTDDRFSTLCIYELRNQRTALDIAHISVYPYEEEVLILPYSAFKIIDIKQNKYNSPRVEIQLKECEPW